MAGDKVSASFVEDRIGVDVPVLSTVSLGVALLSESTEESWRRLRSAELMSTVIGLPPE